MPVQRGVVKGSNMEGPAGNKKNNGFMPLPAAPARSTRRTWAPGGDKRNGSFPLSAGGPMTNPPRPPVQRRPGRHADDAVPDRARQGRRTGQPVPAGRGRGSVAAGGG